MYLEEGGERLVMMAYLHKHCHKTLGYRSNLSHVAQAGLAPAPRGIPTVRERLGSQMSRFECASRRR